MTQKVVAFNEIADLVERFSEQYDSYKKVDYSLPADEIKIVEGK